MEKVICVGDAIKSGDAFKEGYVYKYKVSGVMFLCLRVDLEGEGEGLVMMDLNDMLADCYSSEYEYREFELQGKLTEIKTVY